MKKAINSFWYDKWTNEKQIKSTLEYLEIQQNQIGTPHNILRSVKNRKYDIQKAEIKLRLITDTYIPASTLRIHNVAVWLLFGQVPFLRANYVATTYFRYVICKSL
jgi:hypothetical protein